MPPIALPTLSPAEVASHCSKKSCYVLVNCNVYDITEFLQDHPGGDGLIIPYGGKDVGAIMRDELSHLHSESAYEILKDYLIGFVAGKPVTGALTAHDKPVDIVPLLPNQDSIVLTAYRADFDADYRRHKFLDLRKPLLMQIWSGGFSSDFYLDQIHRPRHYTYGNSAPIFGNFLEPLTVTKWWIVPIIWLPPVICSFYYAIERLTPTKTAAFCVIGLGLWTLFEYGWHRWICHLDRFLPDKRVFITAHFLIHGCHHYLPMDQQRLVMPPSLATMNGILLHYLITKIFWWEEGINMAVLSGLGLGYIYYEVLHYYLHVAGITRSQYLRSLRLRHLTHHYKNFERGFGVTSGFWDKVFGTEFEFGENYSHPPADKAKVRLL